MNQLPFPNRLTPYDENVLAWFSDYEAVYIIFHPFIQYDQDAVNDTKSSVLATAKVILWQDIQNQLNMTDYRMLNQALQYYHYQRIDPNALFQSYLDKFAMWDTQGLITPEKGNLPYYIENQLFGAIQQLGYQALWLCGEYGIDENNEFQPQKYLIEHLKQEDIFQFRYRFGHCYTEDLKILLTTHHETHYSFLCSSKANIEQILTIYPFEGFYCDVTTRSYWHE